MNQCNTEFVKQKEIRQVVKERTFYADRKFKFLKHDFLRYIQFETLFRLLIRSQTKTSFVFLYFLFLDYHNQRIIVNGTTSTTEIGQDEIKIIRHQFISRINSIYNVALNKYGSDKQLWLLAFDFAKRYSENITSKILKAIILHPN